MAFPTHTPKQFFEEARRKYADLTSHDSQRIRDAHKLLAQVTRPFYDVGESPFEFLGKLLQEGSWPVYHRSFDQIAYQALAASVAEACLRWGKRRDKVKETDADAPVRSQLPALEGIVEHYGNVLVYAAKHSRAGETIFHWSGETLKLDVDDTGAIVTHTTNIPRYNKGEMSQSWLSQLPSKVDAEEFSVMLSVNPEITEMYFTEHPVGNETGIKRKEKKPAYDDLMMMLDTMIADTLVAAHNSALPPSARSTHDPRLSLSILSFAKDFKGLTLKQLQDAHPELMQVPEVRRIMSHYEE
jgi:hypothetical protein